MNEDTVIGLNLDDVTITQVNYDCQALKILIVLVL